MKMLAMASFVLALFFSCEPKKNTDVKKVERDSTTHSVDSIKHFFAKRYGHPRG